MMGDAVGDAAPQASGALHPYVSHDDQRRLNLARNLQNDLIWLALTSDTGGLDAVRDADLICHPLRKSLHLVRNADLDRIVTDTHGVLGGVAERAYHDEASVEGFRKLDSSIDGAGGSLSVCSSDDEHFGTGIGIPR